MGVEPGGADEIWAADLTASRHNYESKVFENILFVEFGDDHEKVAVIYGTEQENDMPSQLEKTAAAKQRTFIKFLANETRLRRESQGPTAALFSGHEYAAEGRALAAYILVRKKKLCMGIGCKNIHGEYVRFCVDLSGGDWFREPENPLGII